MKLESYKVQKREREKDQDRDRFGQTSSIFEVLKFPTFQLKLSSVSWQQRFAGPWLMRSHRPLGADHTRAKQ